MSFKHSCEAAGISEQTGYEWLKKYPEFALEVTRACARAVERLHDLGEAGGKGSGWAMWLLERRFRKDYGDVKGVELSGKDGGPIEIQPLAQKLDTLTTEELRALASGDNPG
jgi:hypothetical protein